MRHLLPLLFSFCAVAASTAAHADTVAFSSASAFASATTGAITYSIPKPANNATFQTVSNPYVVGPLTFSAASIKLFNDQYYGTGQTYLGLDGSRTYTVSVNGISAIAFDLGSFLDPQTLTVLVNGISLERLAIPEAQQSVFLGITSTLPINTISLTPSIGKSEVDILNTEIASTVATTPEPSSFLLLLSGLLSLVVMTQRFGLRSRIATLPFPTIGQ